MKKKRLWKRLGFFLLTLGLILVYLAPFPINGKKKCSVAQIPDTGAGSPY